MENKKITFLKEKEFQKKAEKNYEKFLKKNAQNPIGAKFLAFQKTKKELDFKDFF